MGSFCSTFNWEGADIWPEIRPRKIPGLRWMHMPTHTFHFNDSVSSVDPDQTVLKEQENCTKARGLSPRTGRQPMV